MEVCTKYMTVGVRNAISRNTYVLIVLAYLLFKRENNIGKTYKTRGVREKLYNMSYVLEVLSPQIFKYAILSLA